MVTTELESVAHTNGVVLNDPDTWRHIDTAIAPGAVLTAGSPDARTSGAADRVLERVREVGLDCVIRSCPLPLILRYPNASHRKKAPWFGYHVEREAYCQPQMVGFALLMLSDADSVVGGGNTFVVPGSHRVANKTFSLPSRMHCDPSQIGVQREAMAHAIAWANHRTRIVAEKGDMLLMLPSTVHSASENSSHTMRICTRFIFDMRPQQV